MEASARRVAVVGVQKIEGAADARQHAQRQDIDLEDAERVEIVLVPLDVGAVLHGGVEDRHHLVEAVAGHDEAADVLGEMAREAGDLGGESEDVAHGGLVRIEAGAAHLLVRHGADRPAPHGAVEGADDIVGEAEDLADLADGGARAIGDDGGGEAGAVAAVLVVDVLHHLLAALMLEIDVDVGRLAALGRDETLEEQAAGFRADLGDPQAIADDGIGRGTAPLTQDAGAAGELHDVVDGEEIGREAQLADQLKLVVQALADLRRAAVREAIAHAFFDERLQRLLRAGGVAGGLVGILEAQLVEGEGEALLQRSRLGDGLGIIAEEARHFGRRLQVTLGVGGKPAAGGGQRRLLADAGQHVLQRAAFGGVVVDVVGGGERRAVAAGGGGEAGEAALVAGAVGHRCHQADVAGEGVVKGGQGFVEGRLDAPGGHDAEHHAGAPLEKIGEVEIARAFLGAQIAQRQQAAEAAVSGAGRRPGDDVGGRPDHPVRLRPGAVPPPPFRGGMGGAVRDGRIAEDEAAADVEGKLRLLRGDMGAHDAGERVAVGDGEAGEAQFGGREGQLLRMRAAAQEREIGGDGELGEGGHGR